MGCIPEQYLTHVAVVFPPIKMSFFNQQVQILITTLYSIVAMNSDGMLNNIHYNYSSILRQWPSCSILHIINTILYLFVSSIYKLTMIDLIIVQSHSILDGMIKNNSVININILSSTNVLIIVFSYCNDCKNDGSIIVGINIDTQLYIFKLKRHLNNINKILIER